MTFAGNLIQKILNQITFACAKGRRSLIKYCQMFSIKNYFWKWQPGEGQYDSAVAYISKCDLVMEQWQKISHFWITLTLMSSSVIILSVKLSTWMCQNVSRQKKIFLDQRPWIFLLKIIRSYLWNITVVTLNKYNILYNILWLFPVIF